MSKNTTFTLLVFHLLSSSACDPEFARGPSMEPRQEFSCRVVRTEVEYIDGTHDGYWSCDDGPEKLDLDPDFVQRHHEQLLSGQARVHIRVALGDLDRGGPIDASDVEFEPGDDDRSSAASYDASTTGTREVLVVRVLGPSGEDSHPFDEATVARRVFGGFDDEVNLRSQYLECSHDQLHFEPAREVPNGVLTDGVVTVQLDTPLEGLGARDIARAAQDVLEADLEQQYGHVMYCLPHGTDPGSNWLAFAHMNSSLSVYNADWCGSVTAQMHEVGHNLGIGHSGDGTNKYADTSCVMGYSNPHSESPRLCFNGARSSQLGWYADREEHITGSTNTTYALRGVVDYPLAQGEDRVLLRISNPAWGPRTVHIAYNAAKGPTEGSSADSLNKVLVVETGETRDQPTARKARLEVGESLDYVPFGIEGNALRVHFEQRTEDDIAMVSVEYSPS